jgi:selenocysteine lyase/cysteine desulfurase
LALSVVTRSDVIHVSPIARSKSRRYPHVQILCGVPPRSVRDVIDAHRRRFDENPIEYHAANNSRCERAVSGAVTAYLGLQADEIALTDSTTMGLGLLYVGFRLRANQEIVMTTLDHFATSTSLHLRPPTSRCRRRL